MKDTHTILDADGAQSYPSPLYPNNTEAREVSPPAKERKAPGSSRELTPRSIGIAWERLRRVVREHCEHPGHERLSYNMRGYTIEFQSALDSPPVLLIRENNLIVKCVAGTEEPIRLVRLKTKGVGFEFRHHRYSATRLLIEIVHEARAVAN